MMSASAAAAAVVVLLLVVSAPCLVNAKINLTPTEQFCLEKTGTLFEGNNELIASRHNYATSMQTEMTSQLTMTAKYPEDQIRDYERVCRSSGGVLHTIKIDFFDCKLAKINQEVELTLKNFANCFADVEECAYFDQENLLEEAWDALGLHCELEDVPGGTLDPRGRDDDEPILMDDDLAHQESKAAAEGADDLDRAEKNSEYVPKEDAAQGKKKKSGGRRFFNFLLVCIVGGVGYVIYDKKFHSRHLPWGGVTTSRFQQHGGGAQTGFVSNYHMLSGEEETMNFGMGGGEHELQLSSAYNA